MASKAISEILEAEERSTHIVGTASEAYSDIISQAKKECENIEERTKEQSAKLILETKEQYRRKAQEECNRLDNENIGVVAAIKECAQSREDAAVQFVVKSVLK